MYNLIILLAWRLLKLNYPSMAGLPPFLNQSGDRFGLASMPAASTPQLSSPISNYQSAISFADHPRIVPVGLPSPAYFGPNAAVSNITYICIFISTFTIRVIVKCLILLYLYYEYGRHHRCQ